MCNYLSWKERITIKFALGSVVPTLALCGIGIFLVVHFHGDSNSPREVASKLIDCEDFEDDSTELCSQHDLSHESEAMSTNHTLALFAKAHEKIQRSLKMSGAGSERDAILLLGQNRVGKSMLTLLLTQDNRHLISYLKFGQYAIRDGTINSESMSIDHNATYHQLESPFFSLPNFLDFGSSLENQIANHYTIWRVINHAQRVKTLLLINYESIAPGKGGNTSEFVDLLNHTLNLMPDVPITKVLPGIALFAMRAPYDEPYSSKILESMVQFLKKEGRDFLNRKDKENFFGHDQVRNGKKLLNTLTKAVFQDGVQNYGRLSFLRLIHREGSLSEMEEIQSCRTHMLNMIRNNLEFVEMTQNSNRYLESFPKGATTLALKVLQGIHSNVRGLLADVGQHLAAANKQKALQAIEDNRNDLLLKMLVLQLPNDLQTLKNLTDFVSKKLSLNTTELNAKLLFDMQGFLENLNVPVSNDHRVALDSHIKSMDYLQQMLKGANGTEKVWTVNETEISTLLNPFQLTLKELADIKTKMTNQVKTGFEKISTGLAEKFREHFEMGVKTKREKMGLYAIGRALDDHLTNLKTILNQLGQSKRLDDFFLVIAKESSKHLVHRKISFFLPDELVQFLTFLSTSSPKSSETNVLNFDWNPVFVKSDLLKPWLDLLKGLHEQIYASQSEVNQVMINSCTKLVADLKAHLSHRILDEPSSYQNLLEELERIKNLEMLSSFFVTRPGSFSNLESTSSLGDFTTAVQNTLSDVGDYQIPLFLSDWRVAGWPKMDNQSYIESAQFLNKSSPFTPNLWLAPFRELTGFLNYQRLWYKFLLEMYTKQSAIGPIFNNGGSPSQHAEYHEATFKNFTDWLRAHPTSIPSYPVAATSPQLAELKHLKNVTMDIQVECRQMGSGGSEWILVIRADSIKLSVVSSIIKSNFSLLAEITLPECVTTAKVHFSKLYILVLNTVILDQDFEIPSQNLVIIAPTWRVISSTGPGPSRSIVIGKSSPGSLGENASHFVGVAQEYIGLDQLQISARKRRGSEFSPTILKLPIGESLKSQNPQKQKHSGLPKWLLSDALRDFQKYLRSSLGDPLRAQPLTQFSKTLDENSFRWTTVMDLYLDFQSMNEQAESVKKTVNVLAWYTYFLERLVKVKADPQLSQDPDFTVLLPHLLAATYSKILATSQFRKGHRGQTTSLVTNMEKYLENAEKDVLEFQQALALKNQRNQDEKAKQDQEEVEKANKEAVRKHEETIRLAIGSLERSFQAEIGIKIKEATDFVLKLHTELHSIQSGLEQNLNSLTVEIEGLEKQGKSKIEELKKAETELQRQKTANSWFNGAKVVATVVSTATSIFWSRASAVGGLVNAGLDYAQQKVVGDAPTTVHLPKLPDAVTNAMRKDSDAWTQENRKLIQNVNTALSTISQQISEFPEELGQLTEQIKKIRTEIQALNSSIPNPRIDGVGFDALSNEAFTANLDTKTFIQQSLSQLEKTLQEAKNGKMLTASTSGQPSGAKAKREVEQSPSVADGSGGQAEETQNGRVPDAPDVETGVQPPTYPEENAEIRPGNPGTAEVPPINSGNAEAQPINPGTAEVPPVNPENVENGETGANPDEKAKKEARKKRMEKLANVIDGASKVVKGVQDFYNTQKADSEKIKDVADKTEQGQENLAALQNHQQRVEDIAKPFIKGMQANLKKVQGSLGNKSVVALDVGKWKVQSTLKDLKLAMSEQFTRGFKIDSAVARSIEKLEEAMTTLINIYDRIQEAQDKGRLARYIADIQLATIASPPTLTLSPKSEGNKTQSTSDPVLSTLAIQIQMDVLWGKWELIRHSLVTYTIVDESCKISKKIVDV